MKIMLYDESIQTRLKYYIGFAFKSFFPVNRLRTISFSEQLLQPDEEIVIPQDDLYTIIWESDFGEQLVTRGNEPIPTSLPNGERPTTAETNPSDAHENEVDYITTRDELNDATDAVHSRNERLSGDVTNRNEVSEATRNEESDWPNPAVSPKTQEKSLPKTDERLKNNENFSKKKFGD